MKKENCSRESDHLRIADMAEQSKPCEKAEKYGVRVLTDAELLAVILRSGSRKENAIILSERLLNLDPSHPGLTGLNYLSVKEMTGLPGIGRVKAIQLKAVAELSRRISKERARDYLRFNEPGSVADFFREDMRYLTKERVTAAFFDSSGGFLRETLISEGTVNRSLVSPREVFIDALSCGAVYFILLHNHPSGLIEPSRDDIMITKTLYHAGEMLGIPLRDHIIIGDHEYLSFFERGFFDEIQL